MSIDLAGGGMVGLSRDALVTLHRALFRDVGANAPGCLQEAGYAGGANLYDAFARWTAARGLTVPEQVGVAEFGGLTAAFFAELGWGELHVSTLHDSVITLDSRNWAESDPANGMQYPGCYFSAGLLADFFGRLAGAQLVALEVECRSMGGDGETRCRFLLGSAETIQHVYDGLTQGVPYDAALAAMA